MNSFNITATLLPGNSSEDLQNDSPHLRIAVSVLLLLFGLPLNGVVIWLLGFRVKRSHFACYVLHLALADFTFLLLMVTGLISDIMGGQYPFGEVVYKIDVFLTVSHYFATSFLLVLISAHRCLSITVPTWYHFWSPRWSSSVSCLVVWLLAFSLSSPELVYDEIVNETSGIDEGFRLWAVGSSSILGFFVPFSLLIGFNSITLIKVRQNARIRSTKLYRIISTSVLIYMFCWFPLNMAELVGFVYLVCHQEPPLALVHSFTFSMLLLYVNSCINPLIYFIIGRTGNQRLRQSLHGIFQKLFNEEYTKRMRSRELSSARTTASSNVSHS
ncbi:C3a anaphylatoxin chemotactic receptor-like [Latimeria chalumnae]|uniref:C3a anaphylatoxin chemotactic receptor-like n=1 Tax=Latimeria chalumnae TaxID=7897 RepID=UPI0003C173FA|nr:PREDICTED: C3a anaphylatoxin chemotactic receptor-like [Latimeria chalumnae]|eukprot:XP_006010067.1 PREDICTED: C3a anaphylatoxin chemotactic receptor-like [Latimeria chalumnae]